MKGGIFLSPTSQKILAIFFAHPGQKFYVNELIRLTGLYPNSIQQALKSLEKQKILLASRSGRLRFHHLNRPYQFLPEIEAIIKKSLPKKEKTATEEITWVKILNRQADYNFFRCLCISNRDLLKESYDISILTFWYNNLTLGSYYLQGGLESLGEEMSKKIESDPEFAKNDVRLCRQTCDQLVRMAKSIPRMGLAQMNKTEIKKLLRKFYFNYLAIFPFVSTPHGTERYFEKQIRESVPDKSTQEILISPVSTEDEERNSAFRVAAYLKENGPNYKSNQLLDDHWQNFCWLPLWTIQAKPLTRDFFLEEIKGIVKAVANPKKSINDFKIEEQTRKRELKSALKKIKASRILVDQVNLLQEYIFLRTYRKNAICQAHYYHLPLLYEVARRLDLTEDQIKLLCYEEIIGGLSNRKSVNNLKKLAGERQSGWAILMWKGKIKIITGVKNIIEIMERYQIVAPGPQIQRMVKGSPACRGRATGRVKVVRKLSELDKVEKGDVLVARMTTPDYMLAIHKASAIVTDEGGVTCHAAIVSREFNLPCIVGTRNATQVLSDNDLVEVDANEGVVRVVEAVEVDENIRQIYGKTAYRGKVCGPARIIFDASDFPKVQEGDILVAPQTTPEYLSSLYKVKGFIVDEESITSHAMLYARALRLPALTGTQFARNVLQDGEMVELDATRGVIKRFI